MTRVRYGIFYTSSTTHESVALPDVYDTAEEADKQREALERVGDLAARFPVKPGSLRVTQRVCWMNGDPCGIYEEEE